MSAMDFPWRDNRRTALRGAAAKAGDPRLALRLDLRRALGHTISLPVEIDFGTGGNSREFILVGGWAAPECHGCWTVGPIAQLATVFDAPVAEPLAICIELSGVFTAPARPSQSMAIDVNGIAYSPWVFADGTRNELRRILNVPVDAVRRHGALIVTFEIAFSDAPYLVGAGDDTRDLGIAVRRMTIAQRSAAAPRLDSDG